MVQMLASHAAGFRLGRVVALLLLPMLWLSFVIVNDGFQQLRETEITSNGLTLLDKAFHLMLSQLNKGDARGNAILFTAADEQVAASAGVSKELKLLETAVSKVDPDPQDILQKSLSLMTAIGNGPMANSLADIESRALATAASTVMPNALVAFGQVKELSGVIMQTQNEASEKFPEIASSAAVLQFNARQLDNLVVRARSQSTDTPAYSDLLRLTSRLNFDSGYFKVLLFGQGGDSHLMMGQVNNAVEEAGAKWSGTLSKGWEGLQLRLQSLNDLRRKDASNLAYRTLCLALLAVLFSLGTSISLFRSTLRRLDEVEASRKDAIVARLDAEQGAKELSQVNDNLAEMNNQMNENLKSLHAAQDQLLKKGRLEQLGHLTATIAHELRNPLGAVRTSAFLLERKTRGKDLGIENQLQRINSGIARCDNTITQLLDFSRSRQVLANQEDFDSWLEKIVSEEAQRLPVSVLVNCKLGLDGLSVAFDAARMQRAVANLISNASEAMVGNGEESSKYTTSDPTITISSVRDGQSIMVHISDNGPGIKPEDLERIREPLFTTKNFGTGLGLPAVEQILAQHGGSLTVNSTLGSGACFTMRIPIAGVEELAA